MLIKVRASPETLPWPRPCSSLRELNIPVVLTTIGTSAFYALHLHFPHRANQARGCSKLTKLALSTDLATIGLNKCSSLTEVVLPTGIPLLWVSRGHLPAPAAPATLPGARVSIEVEGQDPKTHPPGSSGTQDSKVRLISRSSQTQEMSRPALEFIENTLFAPGILPRRAGLQLPAGADLERKQTRNFSNAKANVLEARPL